MNKLSCSVKRIFASKLIFLAVVLTSCIPVCVHGAEGKRNVFLVPVSAETSWQEFAYLAVVPAATRVNNGTPAVVAMNDFGSINREIRHYLSLYKPNKVYIVGKGLQPAGVWLAEGQPSFSGLKGSGGGDPRTVSALVRLEKGSRGGEVISWGRSGPGEKWTTLVREDGTLAIDIGYAFKAGTTDLRDGKWHHVAAVLEKTGKSSRVSTLEVSLYVDGVKEKVGLTFDKTAAPLRNKLTGYWKMDEGHGGTAADSTEYDQTASLDWTITPPFWCEGKFGKGVLLNGIGNRIETQAYRTVLEDQTATGYSVSLWVRVDSPEECQIVGTDTLWGGFGVYCRDGRLTAKVSCLKEGREFKDQWNDLVVTSFEGAASTKRIGVDSGKWHHVAMTYSRETKQVGLYLDGAKVAGGEYQGAGIRPLRPHSKTKLEPLRFGCLNWRDVRQKFLRGAVDEAAIWDRAIAEEEIFSLYNDGKGREIDMKSTYVNTRRSVIMLDTETLDGQMKDVRFYDRALNEEDVFALANVWDYEGLERMPAESADQVARMLAEKFWIRSDKAVVCNEEDYESALVSATLAGRLQVPLLFASRSGRLSGDSRQTIDKLEVCTILFVGKGRTPRVSGVPVEQLKEAKAVIGYLEKMGKKVEYFAVTNPLDRGKTLVRKSSLAAPLLAVGRDGAVVPLSYQTLFKHYFFSKEMVSGPPKGLKVNEEKKMWIDFKPEDKAPYFESGKIYPVNGKYAWGEIGKRRACVAASREGMKEFDLLLVDFNLKNWKTPDDISKERVLIDEGKESKFAQEHVFRIGGVVDFRSKGGNRWWRLEGIETRKDSQAKVSFVNSTWKLGTCEVAGRKYKYVVYTSCFGHLDKVHVDFNHNGRFDDPGEGPITRAQIVGVGKKRYSFSIGGNQSKGDFKYTYPYYGDVRKDLQEYFDTLGRHPEYMCIVAWPDSIPFAILDGQAYQDVEDVPSDFPYGDVDDDPFIEIAIGRMVGQNYTFLTLQASRCLTYNDLIGDPDVWATRQLWTGGFSHNRHMADLKLRNIGYEPAVIHLEDYDKTDVSHFGVIVQDDHGGPGGFGGGFGTGNKDLVLAPCIFEVGGCNTGGIDEDVIENLAVPHFLRAGAVAYIGTMRGTPGCKQHYRRSIWNSVARQATVGQAHRRGLNLLFTRMRNELDGRMSGPDENYKQNRGYMWYCACSEQLYGDPALCLYRPHEPANKAVYLEEKDKGKLLRLHGPEKYWLDYEYTHKNEIPKKSEAGKGQKNVMYTAPGLTGPHGDQRSFVEWRSDNKKVKGIKQISKAAKPLGMQGFSYVDTHQDGTRSIYWIVRLEEFSDNRIKQKVDYLDFELVTE